MNVHSYVKLAAVAMMIALAVVAIKRDRKHPVVVTKVTELIVMTKAHAEDVRVEPAAPRKPTIRERIDSIKQKIVLPHRDPPSRTKSVDGMGKWTFPYSCSKVKWYAAHFSQETLEKMRVMAGEPAPTGEQRQQISECIAGRFQ